MTTTGYWVSQLCNVSKQNFPSSSDNQWGFLKWYEENTDDITAANVLVYILDSDNNVLVAGLLGDTVINNQYFNRSLDLSNYSNVVTNNIKIFFLLTSETALPKVSNIELNCKNDW